MYANEPEIAREWSDRYGAMNGGIMDVASDGNTRHDFANFTNGNNINVPTSFQARPQSDPVNLAYITPQEQGILQTLKPGTPHEGPMGIPNYDSFDAAGGYSNPDTGYSASSGGGGGGWQDSSRADQRVNERAEQVRRNYVNKENIRSSYLHDRYDPNRIEGQRSGIGGLFRGLLSFFGGAPGKAISLLSRINPSRLRGINPTTGLPNTQEEYEEQRQARINQGRIDTILGRDAPITEMTISNLGKLGYTGTMPTVGSTAESRASQTASDKDYATGLNTFEGPYSRTHLQSLANDMNANTTGTNQDYQTALGEGWATDYTGEDTNTNTNYQPQNLPLYPNVGLGAAEGGRIGYERGRVVNPGGYQGMTPFMAWVKDQYGVNVKDIKDWNFYSGLANEWKRLGGSKADGGIARLL